MGWAKASSTLDEQQDEIDDPEIKVHLWSQVEKFRKGEIDVVQFGKGFTAGPFCLQTWAFCKQLFSSQALDFCNRQLSGTGRIRFRRARFETPSSVSFFCPHRVPGGELSEFLSAYFLCQSELTEFFPQNSPSLPQNSVSSPVRNGTLETVFCLFPKLPQTSATFVFFKSPLSKPFLHWTRSVFLHL